MKEIEQIKQALIEMLKFNLTCMYEYEHKDRMHSVYHGMVIAIEDMLAKVYSITTVKNDKKGEE